MARRRSANTHPPSDTIVQPMQVTSASSVGVIAGSTSARVRSAGLAMSAKFVVWYWMP
jgi:hypothetical protein